MESKDLDKSIYPSWDELQKNLDDGTSSFEESKPITKEAAYTGQEIVRSLENTLWAGSNILNEELELEENLKLLLEEEEEEYKMIEDYLYSVGYPREKIRKKYQDMTGIDPVKAYLDVENYSKPPVSVPKYNYGWGEAKKGKGEYYFILPYIDKFAIYHQKDLAREIHSEFPTVKLAREALKKLVKAPLDVTPATKIIDEDILRTISSLQIPKEVTPDCKVIFDVIHTYASQLDLATKTGYIKTSFDEGRITEAEQDWLLRYVTAADKDEEDQDQQEDVKKEIQEYQEAVEHKSFDSTVDQIKVPQTNLEEETNRYYKANIQELTQDAFQVLEETLQMIEGYSVEPIGQSVDLIDVKQYSAIDESHVDAGSVSIVTEITDLRNQDIARGLINMFIKGGRLYFSGKFKGQNDKEYALTVLGLNAYFDDLTGRSLEDMEATTNKGQVVPMETFENAYKPRQ